MLRVLGEVRRLSPPAPSVSPWTI